MYNYIAKRLFFAVFSLIGVLTLIFFIVRVLPGDPALVILGDLASEASLAAVRKQLGLDQSLAVQYWSFMRGALTGDLGRSMLNDRPVLDLISSVLPYTLILTASALVTGCIVGIPLGVWAALRRNRMPDYVTRMLSLLGVSFPSFVSAILLLLAFAIQIRIFPVVGSSATTFWGQVQALVLPTISLGLIMVAYITRVTRSAMLEVLREDYVRTAVAKGMSASTVIWRHAFRNALMPVITVVGLYLGVLMGNSVLTEIVFNRPGLGKLIVSAVVQRDYTLLQGVMVVYTMLFILVNLVTDLVYGVVDPRVQYE